MSNSQQSSGGNPSVEDRQSATETNKSEEKSEKNGGNRNRNQRRERDRNNDRDRREERVERGPPSVPLYTEGIEKERERRPGRNGGRNERGNSDRNNNERSERGERRGNNRQNYPKSIQENRKREGSYHYSNNNNERPPVQIARSAQEGGNSLIPSNYLYSNSSSSSSTLPVAILSPSAAIPSGPLVIGFIGRDPSKVSALANTILERNTFNGNSHLVSEDECVIQHFHDSDENVLYLTLCSGLDCIHSNAPIGVKEELEVWLQKQAKNFIRSFYYMSYVCHSIMMVSNGSRFDSTLLALLSNAKQSFKTLESVLMAQLSPIVFTSVQSGCCLSFILQSNLTDQTENSKSGKRSRENLEKCMEQEMKTLLDKHKWMGLSQTESSSLLSAEPSQLVHVYSCSQSAREPNPMIELFVSSLSLDPKADLEERYKERDGAKYLRKFIQNLSEQFYQPREPKKMPKDWVSIHRSLEELFVVRLASLTTQSGVQSFKANSNAEKSVDESVLKARVVIDEEIERVRSSIAFS
eukprot:TRINITY_DN3109_c0_g1_i3.p1 TRINITY_DN3109_c0_g1~~TRINITY_DN3109_c0_g1_i3.p1  ORF type:complete len:525 (+),score=206.15 TRINITY_DN3109_c0_g1_i3:276-1850(+)